MSLRFKLTGVLAASMIGAVIAVSAVLLRAQQRQLRAAEQDKIRLIVEGVRGNAAEAVRAGDPFMLMDHLQKLRVERPEVAGIRVRMRGRWNEVGAAAVDAGPEQEIRLQGADARTWGDAPRVALRFSAEALAAREHAAFRRTVRDVGVAAAFLGAAALVLANLVGWRLTRRLRGLAAAMDEVGSGRLGLEAEVRGRDEIGDLARRFNAMSRQLSEVEKMKKTFVSSVTHELRSPLGAIESYARLLLRENADPAKSADSLKRILENANRLQRFVTSLLDLARIERGKMDLSLKPCRPGGLVRDTAEFFAPKAREAGLELRCSVADDLPEMKLDPDMIGHVMTNLISNALKFTPAPGTVDVSAALAGPVGERAVRVEVRDSGVGIGPEDAKRLFAPFSRVKNETGAGGTGLGLALAKEILGLHGGTIGVDSERGKGSTFWFELPLRPGAVNNPAKRAV